MRNKIDKSNLKIFFCECSVFATVVGFFNHCAAKVAHEVPWRSGTATPADHVVRGSNPQLAQFF